MLKTSKRALLAAVAITPLLAGSAWAEGLISIIVTDPSNPYWLTEGKVAEATAKELGYTATVAAHKGDTNTESNLIDTAITNKSVAIILDPANADGSIGAVKKAVAAGIPVFLVNAEINQEGLAKAQLVSNNAQGAALGAQQWVESVRRQGQVCRALRQPRRQQRRHPLQRLRDGADPVSRSREVGAGSRQLGPHPGLQQDAVACCRPIRTSSASSAAMTRWPWARSPRSRKPASSTRSRSAASTARRTRWRRSRPARCSTRVLQPVAVFSAEAVRQADSFIKTGKTGADSEKQLFDCILITKDNADDFTGPFTMKQ